MVEILKLGLVKILNFKFCGDCRVGQLTRLHPGFLSVRFISLHRGSEGLQDIKAFQKKMILNVLKSKERFLYPSWYGGLRADCPSVGLL